MQHLDGESGSERNVQLPTLESREKVPSPGWEGKNVLGASGPRTKLALIAGKFRSVSLTTWALRIGAPLALYVLYAVFHRIFLRLQRAGRIDTVHEIETIAILVVAASVGAGYLQARRQERSRAFQLALAAASLGALCIFTSRLVPVGPAAIFLLLGGVVLGTSAALALIVRLAVFGHFD